MNEQRPMPYTGSEPKGSLAKKAMYPQPDGSYGPEQYHLQRDGTFGPEPDCPQTEEEAKSFALKAVAAMDKIRDLRAKRILTETPFHPGSPYFDGESVLTKTAREDDPNGGTTAPPNYADVYAAIRSGTIRDSNQVYPTVPIPEGEEPGDGDKECGPCRESAYTVISRLVDQKRRQLVGLEALLKIAKACETDLDGVLYNLAHGERLV